MKILFTLVVLFSIATKIPAQKISAEARIALAADMIAAPQKDSRVKTGCTTYAENKYVRPLLVIDGVPDESAELQKLDADNIASIDVLKKDKLGVLGCHSPNRDIFLIITKSGYTRKFIVKDFLTGEKIPAATIRFTSIKDTITAVADENGSLVIDKLKTGTEYDITVSSAGYKTFSALVISKQQAIFLERDVKECANVVVTNPNCWRRRVVCYSLVTITKESPLESKIEKDNICSVYPNPVQRNAIFNLEFENIQDETMQLAIISLSGSIVSLQSKTITRGLNRLSITADAKWAAGIYNIQLRNEKGTLIRQEKLIVQ